MKMAKASERDLRMALDLSSLLEGFEKGYFPGIDEDEGAELFNDASPDDCQRAMELILDKLREGSLFRVTFGMTVLLDPRNECVDPDLPHIDHHPKTKLAREMHDELVAALSGILRLDLEKDGATAEWVELQAAVRFARAAIAKLPEGR